MVKINSIQTHQFLAQIQIVKIQIFLQNNVYSYDMKTILLKYYVKYMNLILSIKKNTHQKYIQNHLNRLSLPLNKKTMRH